MSDQRCHGVVDSTCDTESGGRGSIPSHDTKVNSAFHPFEVDKWVPGKGVAPSPTFW